MKQTLAEKLISKHAQQNVTAGDIAIVDVDGTMATDTTAPLAMKAFEAMGGKALWDATKVSLILDHATPAPNERISNLHQMMRDFSKETGCHFYDVGEGICHQLMVDNQHVKTGDIFVGADSHTPTYGAVGAFAVGMGSTDVAGIMLTGKTWLKVPETIKLILNGEIPVGISAKDIILYIVGELGIAGATYDAVEFTGEVVQEMSLASRMTLANMVAEMGAKTALVDTKKLELPYSFEQLSSDEGASYKAVHEFDMSTLRPQLAVPHSPDDVTDIDVLLGRKVDAAFIGSCTNARLEDLHAAAEVLKGNKVKVRLIIAPASRAIFNKALKDGTIATLSEAGASFITSGCGPCVGTHQGIPANGETVISSTNRNFKGRQGNPNADVYLASPAVVAAAAVAGKIIDPADLIQKTTSVLA